MESSAIFRLSFSFLILLIRTDSAAPPPQPTASECVPELVSFSACLAFVSSPPNNLSDTVSPECCTAFTETVGGGGGLCFCHLLREPKMLGFPLEADKLVSLPSVCHLRGHHSLQAFCSGSESEALPPSPEGTDSAIASSPNSEAPSSQSSPSIISMPPSSSNDSPAPETASRPLPIRPRPAQKPPILFSSSAPDNWYCTKKIWFQMGTILMALFLSS